MDRKELTVALPGINRPAIIRLCRAGQVPPAEGDDVRVRWELQLPTEGKTHYLHEECRFGDRCGPVGNRLLTMHWGARTTDRPGYVARDGYSSAPTWAAAFRLAEEFVLGELGTLIKALEARQRALEAAEGE